MSKIAKLLAIGCLIQFSLALDDGRQVQSMLLSQDHQDRNASDQHLIRKIVRRQVDGVHRVAVDFDGVLEMSLEDVSDRYVWSTQGNGSGTFVKSAWEPYHLAPGGRATCDSGTTPGQTQCLAAVLALARKRGRTPGRRHLSIGSGGGCMDGSWGQVPGGCSTQSGGDFGAHYKHGAPQRQGCVSTVYQLVCSNPRPVEAKWNSWGSWGQCTKTCGKGSMSRSRSAVAPKHGGKAATGSSKENRDCNTNTCPKKPTTTTTTTTTTSTTIVTKSCTRTFNIDRFSLSVLVVICLVLPTKL